MLHNKKVFNCYSFLMLHNEAFWIKHFATRYFLLDSSLLIHLLGGGYEIYSLRNEQSDWTV